VLVSCSNRNCNRPITLEARWTEVIRQPLGEPERDKCSDHGSWHRDKEQEVAAVLVAKGGIAPAAWQLYIYTHTRLTALYPGLPGWACTRKVKSIWILLKQETVSGSGISWTVCKSADNQLAPHRSVFTGRIPFRTPNQQCQSTEGKYNVKNIDCGHFNAAAHTWVSVLQLAKRSSVQFVCCNEAFSLLHLQCMYHDPTTTGNRSCPLVVRGLQFSGNTHPVALKVPNGLVAPSWVN